MTQQEKEALLEEAKRRYPIGCTIKSIQSGSEYNISSYESKWAVNRYLQFTSNQGYTPCVYDKEIDKWSEIISYPEGYKQQEEEIIFSLY